MNRLQGKTAVITGGNSGVGAAAALLFAREGANVVISARRQAALDEVAEKIRAEGGSVLTVATDISKDGAMKGTNRELYRSLSEKFGLDIIASGGVSSLDDIRALAKMDLYGAILGKALYTGAVDLAEAIKEASNDN